MAYPVNGCPDYDFYDPPPDSGDCWAVCDWLEYTLELPPPLNYNNVKLNDKFEDVVVGRDGDNTVFWVTCQDEGELTIVLSDIRGNIISNYNEQTNGTFNTVYLDLNNNPSGAYFYQVIINKRLLDKGKLLINK